MIIENLKIIRDRISKAALRAGRKPDEISLLAVSKRKPLELIEQAADAGQILFGENYLQDAQEKINRIEKKVFWHFIGGIQSNKAKLIAELFDTVETVDRLKIARALDTHLLKLNKKLQIYIQVNIGREPQKSGVLPEDSCDFIEEVLQFENLQIKGLMAMPPYNPDPEETRPYFKEMRVLRGQAELQMNQAGHDIKLGLSMGMSNDFEAAIEEGSTLVRVGTALFGERD